VGQKVRKGRPVFAIGVTRFGNRLYERLFSSENRPRPGIEGMPTVPGSTQSRLRLGVTISEWPSGHSTIRVARWSRNRPAVALCTLLR
jgi:hypothetical protein